MLAGSLSSFVARSNLRVRTGDSVTVAPAPDVKYGKAVHVLPFEDTLAGSDGTRISGQALHDRLLQPYFRDSFRPLHKGDTFIARAGTYAVEFKVLDIDSVDRESDENCIVMGDTEICYDGEALTRDDDERLSEIGYDDIGGCQKQLAQVRGPVLVGVRFARRDTMPLADARARRDPS